MRKFQTVYGQMVPVDAACHLDLHVDSGSLPVLLEETSAQVAAALEQREVTGDLAGYHRALVAIVLSEPRDVDAWAHLGHYYLDLADPATPQPPGAPVPDSRRRRSWVQTALGCYQTAIGAAELALPDPFGGLLTWSHLENRPFFRAMNGMGAALWQTDRLDDAVGNALDDEPRSVPTGTRIVCRTA